MDLSAFSASLIRLEKQIHINQSAPEKGGW